ncbi:MAG: hypothetical protein HYV90_00750 [Candidatus Woesebacteria bacterium]|nr:MAG: hypothetical protein HYV90_00750 [Candidatus Woesebacteria bacterium]
MTPKSKDEKPGTAVPVQAVAEPVSATGPQVLDAEDLVKAWVADVPNLKMIMGKVRLAAILLTNNRLGLDVDLAFTMMQASIDGVTPSSVQKAIADCLVVVANQGMELADRISKRTTREMNPEAFEELDRIAKAEFDEQDLAQAPAQKIQDRVAGQFDFFNDLTKNPPVIRVVDLWKEEQSRPVAETGIAYWRGKLGSAFRKIAYAAPAESPVVLDWATLPVLDMKSEDVVLLLKQLTFMEQLEAKLGDPDAVLKQLANMTWNVERIQNMLYGANALAANQIGNSATIKGVAQAEVEKFAAEVAKYQSVRSTLAEADEYARGYKG